MGNKLEGKCAIVTGSGRGVGRAVALALAEEGAKVVVNGVTRTPEEGADLAPVEVTAEEIRKLGGEAAVSYDPVGDFVAAERLTKLCVDTFGRLDILVNVAGIVRDRMIHNMSEEEWDSVLDTHLKGTFNMCHFAAGLMRAQKSGRIINTGSAAWQGAVGQVNYSASKGGIASLTRTLARELGRYGITVNCIIPMAATRITANEQVKANFKRQYEEGKITWQVYQERINMPGPEHVGRVAAYLASDAAADINGLLVRSAGGVVGIYNEPKIWKIIHKDVNKFGAWELDELEELFPKILLNEYVNPQPPVA